MRLSMGGRYLDLRYKVLDAEKALRLGQGKTPSYLVDDASGTKLLMPRPPAEGAFPPTGNKLAPGRMYYAMIANPNGKIQSGSQLAFQVSGAGPTNLVVQ